MTGYFLPEQAAREFVDLVFEEFNLRGRTPVANWTESNLRQFRTVTGNNPFQDLQYIAMMIADDQPAVWRLVPNGMSRAEFTRIVFDELQDNGHLNEVMERILTAKLSSPNALNGAGFREVSGEITNVGREFNPDRPVVFPRGEGAADDIRVQPEDVAAYGIIREVVVTRGLPTGRNEYVNFGRGEHPTETTTPLSQAVANSGQNPVSGPTIPAGYAVLAPEAVRPAIDARPINALTRVITDSVNNVDTELEPEVEQTLRNMVVTATREAQAHGETLSSEQVIERVAHTLYARSFQLPVTDGLMALVSYYTARNPEIYGSDAPLPVGGTTTLPAGQEANFAAYVQNMFRDNVDAPLLNTAIAWRILGVDDRDDTKVVDISPRIARPTDTGPWLVAASY